MLQNLSEADFLSLINRAENLKKNGICCPRKCHVTEATPPCGAVKNDIKVASFAVHEGEEPPVTGYNGAGNIFFSGCALKCVFCQNYPISHLNQGKIFTVEQFSEEILKLQSKKVHNINLTTADHYIYPILKSLYLIRNQLKIPISFNCSGYMTEEMAEIVSSFCDIFLYDIKYADETLAVKYSKAPDYFEVSIKAFMKIVNKGYDWIENDYGILQKGIIVRHLVLPGYIENSIAVVEKLAELRDKGYNFKLSLMSQFFPAYQTPEKYPEINRKVTEEEYTIIVDKVEELELDGWIQPL